MGSLAPHLWLTIIKNRYVEVRIIAEVWKQNQAGRFLRSLPRG